MKSLEFPHQTELLFHELISQYLNINENVLSEI